jgi:DNA polymerase III delta prime subunit
MNISEILERNHIATEIKNILSSFNQDFAKSTYKKGIYIYGSPGCGKTFFVTELLESLGYDVIKYDAGDVRNKSLIDTITNNNISNRNVLDMMRKKIKPIAIVMDEIDGMNNGDKGGINALIKLIRQKKTKKQKMEILTMNPIICIGNYYVDKKIKELMKVCHVFELKSPTKEQMGKIFSNEICYTDPRIQDFKPQILDYIQGDMRKMIFMCNLCKTRPEMVNRETLESIFQTKSFNEDAKKITATLIQRDINIEKHNIIMNDTDRTIVALLWHENISDVLDKTAIDGKFAFYGKILDNMCYADYIDRITFQNQIWIFNEMSSMMKTFYNNHLFHMWIEQIKGCKNLGQREIRFTKVLTKYSTEYNNSLFIYDMAQELNLDKKDTFALFQELRVELGQDFLQKLNICEKVEEMFENYNISKLDIRRMYRFLDKNVKKEAISEIIGDDGDIEE